MLEIGWAAALKASEGFTRPVLGMVGLAIAALSLFLLALALRTLPVSVTYTIWVGIGTGCVAIYGVELGAAAILLSLNQAVLYLAIALSGVVGAIGINWIGERYLGLIAACLAVIALGNSVLAKAPPAGRTHPKTPVSEPC